MRARKEERRKDSEISKTFKLRKKLRSELLRQEKERLRGREEEKKQEWK